MARTDPSSDAPIAVPSAGATGASTAGSAHKGKLLAATALIGGFFLVELVGGLLTNSLALLSDAAHMFTDVLGLGMALAAIQAAAIGTRNSQRTFGLYRLEILAALANAVLLFGVAIYILVEAVRRFGDPPEVLGTPQDHSTVSVPSIPRPGALHARSLQKSYTRVSSRRSR